MREATRGQMLIISKEAMESILSLKAKIADTARTAECIADLEKMIEVKDSHLYRADCGSCCGSICSLTYQIDNELGMLQEILGFLKEGNSKKAASLFEEYIAFLKVNYQPESPNIW